MTPEERDAHLRQPRPGDDNPARLTACQTYKIAAILNAIENGHGGWVLYLSHVAKFLQAAALEASTQPGLVRPGTADLWPELDALPWPPIGRPRPGP